MSTASKPDSNLDLNADVIVIGGGPAGSAAATMLARKGWQVTVLEREKFPRDHVGESLLPASIPVLEELGALPAVESAGFLPKYGATMVWGSGDAPWSWYFKETSQRYPHSYQVWRPQFDQILLDNAKAQGVTVLEGHHVTEVIFDGGEAVGVEFTSANGETGEGQARFIVDASGQSTLLARHLESKEWDPFFQNLAVYAYFTGAKPLPEPDQNNIFIESYRYGWLWTIPLHTGRSSVGVVVDSDTGKEGIQQNGAKAFLEAQLAQSSHTRAILENAMMDSEPTVVMDWSYTAGKMYGPGYILAGDAACFVDPLFSSGVHLALMSGVLAAAYVTTALNTPSMAEEAGEVYQELYLKEYNQFREMARLFYSSNLSAESYFWEARRITNSDEYSPRHSFIQAVAGQPPRGYERVVLERGQAPEKFIESVKTVETERLARTQWLAALAADPQRNQILNAVPRLAEGVQVQRKPVLAEGEFVPGQVLNTVSQPEGTPCSPLVAAVIGEIDGQKSVADIVDGMGQHLDQAAHAQLEEAVSRTIEILYVDGTVAGLVTD
ncbi:MAG: tryptophan halogenase [Dehalococcoidia bacterium]|jgi:flavin-dependent dehydrogenase|nr:FAD-dependent oxidoreductase [Dehalococcoidia bacterium]PCJ72694.1 MAG: tryptophan halogenase [Dehalococcoidia bacterium]RUA32830.1 MAG: tryptophan halogenase [Chloroflexota bacterium]